MFEERIKEILAQATLKEKCMSLASVIVNGTAVYGAIPRLGLNGLVAADNPRGVHDALHEDDETRLKYREDHVTAYPPSSVIAAGWDENMAEDLGRALGEDARGKGKNIIFRPAMNIKRHPTGGRHFEYYSEDPVLTGELAGSYVIGMQSRNVAADVKHFAVNSQEFERMTTNAIVSERTLREIYLRAFEIAIKKGNPWTIMTSYNKINGEWSNSNRHIMKDILRDEWGYKGVVISDGFAIQDRNNKVEAHLNGMDLENSGYEEHLGEIMDAYYAGQITMEHIDEEVGRLLELYFRMCENQEQAEIDHEAHHQLAIRAAENGIVLLKNECGILPLAKDKQVAIIGKTAEVPAYMGGGSGHQNARTLTCLLNSVQDTIVADKIVYVPGYPDSGFSGIADYEAYDENMLDEAVKTAEKAETVILCVGNTFGIESEGYDRNTMDLPRGQMELIRRVCAVNDRVILVVSAGAPVTLAEFVPDVKGIVLNWLGGEGMGQATANVLFGDAEPGGRLPETWPIRIEDTPAFLSWPHYPNPTHYAVYGEGVYVGYRWYEKRKLPVLFPFGYGLSYTAFEISDLVLSADKVNADAEVKACVKVKNIGERAGSTVVQLYVQDVESSIDRPVKELKAFKKVFLEAGEETVVEFTLDRNAFAFWSEECNTWVVEDGDFNIMIGDSCAHIVLCSTLHVSSDEPVFRYNRFTPLEWFVNDPHLAEAVEDFPDEIKAIFLNAKGGLIGMAIMIPICRFATMSTGGLFGSISMDVIDTLIERLNKI